MATGNKKKTPAKPAAAAANKRKPAKKAQPDPRWSILLAGLGLLFLALCFVPGESAWAWIRENILFGAFGICGWLTGPMLIYWAVLVGTGKPAAPAIIKSILLLLALSGAALVFGKTELKGVPFGNMLKLLLELGATKFGGGLLSLVFGVPLLLLAGRPAANILLVLIVLMAAMLLTGITPGDIGRFFSGLAQRIPRREKYDDDDAYYDEEYDEDARYYEEEPPLGRVPAAAPPPAGRQRKRMPSVDIDLGPAEPKREPGPANTAPVEVGPGGTFGMNPLDMPVKRPAPRPVPPVGEEEILPFDPFSKQSLFDADAPGGDNLLLFGKDDPYANLGGAESRLPRGNLFDVEYVPPPAAGTGVDLFGQPDSILPVQPAASGGHARDLFAAQPAPLPDAGLGMPPDIFPDTPAPADGGKPDAVAATTAAVAAAILAGPTPGADPSVDALIDKAAAAKPDQQAPAADTRPAATALAPYRYPPVALFEHSAPDNNAGAREEMKKTADLLVSTLASFGVQTRILDVSRGPAVTRYEIQPQAGVKISRITNLADDIALNLAAAGVRIEAPIPGKPAVGIEVPNRVKSAVSIRSILESPAFTGSTSPLSIALGKDIAGDCVVADLTKMPHLLIAGSTGSGKSVCVNATIMSFLYHSSPEDLRLLLIDPKVVELAEYNGIPHLLMPVVTEPRKAASALGAAVAEMERRYHLFAEYNVRDIRTFNKLAARKGGMEKLPYIAIVIDELADLMMTAGKEVEDYICRIAQKARAAGMHLIVATQRPSVDVITGLIKANIPSRIAFAVSSQVDSRTILDGAGAEKLLGMGDMLFMPVGANKPVRVQGTYVKDKEISSVLRYIKQNSEAQYDEGMIEEMERRASAEESGRGGGGGDDMLADETFVAAVETALELGEISTSFLQRRLRLGYARAGRLMDEMERLGIVSGPNGSKPRQVLINRQQWLEMSMNATDDSAY